MTVKQQGKPKPKPKPKSEVLSKFLLEDVEDALGSLFSESANHAEACGSDHALMTVWSDSRDDGIMAFQLMLGDNHQCGIGPVDVSEFPNPNVRVFVPKSHEDMLKTLIDFALSDAGATITVAAGENQDDMNLLSFNFYFRMSIRGNKIVGNADWVQVDPFSEDAEDGVDEDEYEATPLVVKGARETGKQFPPVFMDGRSSRREH